MLFRLFNNVWGSFLSLLLLLFVHSLIHPTLNTEVDFFVRITGIGPTGLLFLRSLAIVVSITLWSEAFRHRLLSEGNRFVGLVMTIAVLVFFNHFWIAKEIIVLILVALIFRRLMSSTDVLNPAPPMFEAGVLVAFSALLDARFFLLLLPLILGSLFLGRVNLRLLIVPLFGMLSTAWLLWGLVDVFGGDKGSLEWSRRLEELQSVQQLVSESIMLKPAHALLIPAIWIAYLGFKMDWINSRAVERQILQTMFWSMLLFMILIVLPFAGGRLWWTSAALPFSLLAAKTLGSWKRPWLREIFLLGLMCIPFLHLLFLSLLG